MEENKEMKEREEFELKASGEAINYISSIKKEDWDGMLFQEDLVTSFAGKDCGKFSISVKPGNWHEKDCYVIHVTEETLSENVPRVINIIAHVDQNFTTLEQSVHEYIKIPDKIVDKKTVMVLDGKKYVVQRTVTQENFERKTHETYSVKQLPGFICEGCHVVVQRILLKKEIPDNMTFLTFDSDANLSRMTFKILEDKETKFLVGEETAVTVGIQSKIFSPLEQERVWDSFFLSDGHLIYRTQAGSNLTIRQLHLPRPPTPEQVVITPLKWEEDMQLLSQFTDRKEELMDEHNTYIRRHPELHAILADFLQFLLLRKPDNVLEFAKDFFGGMSLSPSTQNS